MKTTKSAIIRISVVLILLALVIGAMTISASAATQSVTFETKSWNSSTEKLTSTTTTKTATVIDGSETQLGTAGETTYYVVSSDVTTAGAVSVYGEVHIILDANYTIGSDDVGKNLYLETGATLHIHKKTNGGKATLSARSIYATSTDEENENIYIHDGTVAVKEMLGSYNDNTFGDLLIYGGTVNAQRIAITAIESGNTAGTIGIYGGTVKAINTDSTSPAIGVSGSKLEAIEIYNAMVTAQLTNDSNRTAAVIGTTSTDDSIERIVIKNSKVNAYNSGSASQLYGSAIGHGSGGSIGSIKVADSELSLSFGNYGVGIGGSDCSSVEITNTTATINEENRNGKDFTAGVKANKVTVTSSELLVHIEGGLVSEYKGYGIVGTESVTINSGSFNFSQVGTGISCSGTLTISGGVFAANTYISETTPKNSNGDELCRFSITIPGANKDATINAINTNKGSYGVSRSKILTDDKNIACYLTADTVIMSIKVDGVEYCGALKGTTEKTGTFNPKCMCSSFAEGFCTKCGSREPAELRDGYYLIYDLNDLLYVKDVIEGNLKDGSLANNNVNVKLMANIDIGSNTIGNSDYPYKGIFDGNGYTLTSNTSTFPAADGATFKNLIYAGGRSFSFGTRALSTSDTYGGLVTVATGNTVTFEKCIVSSSYEFGHSTSSKTAYDVNFGAFVGYSDADIVINNCAYTGKIKLSNIKDISCMVGKSAPSASITISNSYVHTDVNFYNSGTIYAFSKTSNNNTVSNCYYGFTMTKGGTQSYGVANNNGATFVNIQIKTDFSDGNITYLLNGRNSEGVWKQTLDGDTPDALPNFTGKKVQYNLATHKYDNHEHSLKYSLATVNSTNDSILIKCDGCISDGLYATLTPPTEQTYDPSRQKLSRYPYSASVTNSDLVGGIVYYEGGSQLESAPYNAGTYTASVKAGSVTASINYTVAKYSSAPTVSLSKTVTDTTTVSGDILDVSWDSYMTRGKDYDYTIEFVGVDAFYYDKDTYAYKIIPTDTRNIDTFTGNVTINVKDATAPEAKLEIGDTNITLAEMSDGTMSYFFKSAKTVKVSAADNARGSGIKAVEYFLSDTAYESIDALEAAASWAAVEDNEIALSLNSTVFVYLRVTDNGDNKTYAFSNGIVLYTDSAAVTEVNYDLDDEDVIETISYTKTGRDNVTAMVALNGNTVAKIMNGDDELSADAYSVTDEGTIIFVAEKLDEVFLAGEYTLTVHYAPRGFEYVEGAINEAPATTDIKLIVDKAEGKVSNISDIGKEYDGLEVSVPEYDSLSGGNVTYEYRIDNEGSEFSTTAPTNVGNYVVRVTVAADDYYTEASDTATFEITKAPLTVKAKDHTIKYGDAPANAGVGYEGFKNGETYTVLSGTLEYNYDYEQFDVVSEDYSITVSGYQSDNYDIKYEKGVLTVQKKDVSFTTADQSIMKGELIDIEDYTQEGLLEGHRAVLIDLGSEIVVDKIFDADDVDVTENYNISYASKGVYHCFDTEYTNNGTNHWHACMVDECEVVTGTAPCTGGFATCSQRASCSVCRKPHGATDPLVHSYTNYISDDNANADIDGTKSAICDYGCGKYDVMTELGSHLEVIVSGYDLESVKSSDKDDLENVNDDIDTLFDSNLLSDSESADLEAAKANVEKLIGKIENIASDKAEALNGVASYNSESVKSSDKESIENLIDDIDALLATDNLTEDEKTELESAKADAEGLIQKIAATSAAKVEDEEGFASYEGNGKSVNSDDKASIDALIEDISALLETDNYTEDEKAELESIKSEAEALVAAIDKAAESKAEVNNKLLAYDLDSIDGKDEEDIISIIANIDTLLEDGGYTAAERAELESSRAAANELLEKIESDRTTTTVIIIVTSCVVLGGGAAAVWFFSIKKKRLS